MFAARCVGTSTRGRCFPHSSSKEASKGLQWVQGSPKGALQGAPGPSQGVLLAWERHLPFGVLLTPICARQQPDLLLVHSWPWTRALAAGAAPQAPAVATAVHGQTPGQGWSFGWAISSWHCRASPAGATQGLMAINRAAKGIFWFQFNFAFACGLHSRMFILTQ